MRWQKGNWKTRTGVEVRGFAVAMRCGGRFCAPTAARRPWAFLPSDFAHSITGGKVVRFSQTEIKTPVLG